MDSTARDDRPDTRPGASDDAPEWLAWCDREIRAQPLTALTIAAAAGFVLGGGLRSRVGRAMLLVAGRGVVRSAVYGFIAGLMETDGNRPDDTASRGTGSGPQ